MTKKRYTYMETPSCDPKGHKRQVHMKGLKNTCFSVTDRFSTDTNCRWLKMPLWSPRQSKSTWRPGDEWRGAGSHPSHSRPTGFPKPFPILDALTATQTQQLAESPRWFPDLWSKSYCERRGQVEATRTATTYKTKAMLHSWRECQH